VAMLKVSRLATIVTKAGNASVVFLPFHLGDGLLISAPQESAWRGWKGESPHHGEKNTAARKQAATITLLIPVRAPTAHRRPLQYKLVTVEVPVNEPKTFRRHRRATPAYPRYFSVLRSRLFQTPTSVPTLSKRSTKEKRKSI